MPTSRRRVRRSREHAESRPPGPPTTPAAASIAVTVPLPDWKWKTFPVFFAFAVGTFIGVYAGFVAGALNDQTITLVVFVGIAILFGFALSRFTTRWLMSKNWIKPRAPRVPQKRR